MLTSLPLFKRLGHFFHQSDRSKWQTMKWTTMSGVCEPVGAALFGLLLKPFLTEAVVKGMLAAGAFVAPVSSHDESLMR
jgi:zinc transporter ZupT